MFSTLLWMDICSTPLPLRTFPQNAGHIFVYVDDLDATSQLDIDHLGSGWDLLLHGLAHL